MRPEGGTEDSRRSRGMGDWGGGTSGEEEPWKRRLGRRDCWEEEPWEGRLGKRGQDSQKT